MLLLDRDIKYITFNFCLNVNLINLSQEENGSRIVVKLLDSQYIEVTILILSIVGAEVEHLSKDEWGNLVVQKCLISTLTRAQESREVMRELYSMLTTLGNAVATLAVDK